MAKTTQFNGVDKNGIERTLIFGALSFGYLKENSELVKKVGVRTGMDDLIEQEPFAMAALAAGKGDDQPENLNDFEIPDINDIYLKALEASGFTFVRVESSPAGPQPVPGK